MNHRVSAIALVVASLISVRTEAGRPEPVPPAFATGEKGLTFQTPRGSTYCPLPDDWQGSDHGTVLFLAPPVSCGGAGYPSSSRGFSPENTPRVEVYYGYWMGDDIEKRPPCHKAGMARLFAKQVPICRDVEDGMVIASVWSTYSSDVASEVSLSLITTPQREVSDTKILLAMADTVRTCSEEWRDLDRKGKVTKTFIVGVGPRCPANSYF